MVRLTKQILIAFLIGFFMPLSILALDLKTTTVGNRECYIYDVKKGENIYDVSRALGVPTIEITRYNPSATDGLRPGMRLYVPVAIVNSRSNKPTITTVTTAEDDVSIPAARSVSATGVESSTSRTYTVQKKESLYAISRKLGISMDSLIAMNPSAENGVKPGDVLVINSSAAQVSTVRPANDPTTEPEITQPATYRPEVAQATTTEPDPTVSPIIPQEEIDYSLIPSENRLNKFIERVSPEPEYGQAPDTVNMAVILPFMLSEDPAPKNSQLFLEFYKGLLLAADSLKHHPGHFIKIHAYDSEGSIERIESIMRSPEMSSMNLIIGPDNESHLKLSAETMSANTYLFNTFNVKSDIYTTNNRVMQANIPHSPMLRKATSTFTEMYQAYTPVFLSRIDGAADKDAFTSLLKEQLDKNEVAYTNITFRNLLNHRDLDTLATDRNYVFVPISGSRAEFAKISEAISRFGEARPENSIRIFGYPDWITFRGEYLTRLGNMEATIYTRFYADKNDPETRLVEERYKELYGQEMMDAAPVQGLLGFDTGIYLIDLIKEYGKDFADNLESFRGLQSVMNFTSKNDEGYVNDALLIVTFTPRGHALKTVIE